MVPSRTSFIVPFTGVSLSLKWTSHTSSLMTTFEMLRSAAGVSLPLVICSSTSQVPCHFASSVLVSVGGGGSLGTGAADGNASAVVNTRDKANMGTPLEDSHLENTCFERSAVIESGRDRHRSK